VARYRFSDVELDLDRFEVTRAGRRLALEPKAVLVLQFLVERPGRLVTKDDLLDGVWPGVAVTPNALTRVIAQLRRELGDDASDARVIETVPTRGYRFIAELETLPSAGARDGASPEPPAATPQPAVPQAAPPSPRAAPRWRWGIAAVAALGALWAVSAGRSEPSPGAAASAVETRPGDIASVNDVAYSPDGRWLAVSTDASGDFEIELRDLSTGQARPLTADGMRSVHPTWSPDSTRVAFHAARRRGVWVMEVGGGVARQVSPVGSRPAWSPDGRWIVVQSDEWVGEWAQPGSHLLLVPADGSAPPRILTRAGEPAGGHGRPVWSPDGATVYFEAFRNQPIDLWSVRVSDGRLTQRATNWNLILHALTDGPSGVVAWVTELPPSDQRLLRVPVGDGVASLQRVPDLVIDDPGRVRAMALAPGGRRAMLVRETVDIEIWTVPVTASGAAAGPGRRLTRGRHPTISPDGRRVAYDRLNEIWIVNTDGTGDHKVVGEPRRALYPTWKSDSALFALGVAGLTKFLAEIDLETGAFVERLPLPEATTFPRVAPDGDTVLVNLGEPLNQIGRGSIRAGTFAAWDQFAGFSFPVWSPDGRHLALEVKVGLDMSLHVGDVATGATRLLSPREGQYWPASFSPDGRRIALGAYARGGVFNIETIDVETGARVALTRETSPERALRYPSWSPRGDVIAYERMVRHGALVEVDLPARGATASQSTR